MPRTTGRKKPKKPQGTGLDLSKQLIATTVLGERGQIVIPKDIRQQLGLKAGARLVVIQHHPGAPVMLVPVEHLRHFVSQVTQNMDRVLSKLS